MTYQTAQSEDLIDPQPGDPISAAQVRIQNSILRRGFSFPNSLVDSGGARFVQRQTTAGSVRLIEITHIDNATLGFEMYQHGICLGKYVSLDTDEQWNKKYDSTILEYEPVGEERDDYIFIGFLDQSKAGVPGQRYFGIDYGSKTAAGLTGGDLTLPLVLVEGGSPVACVLAEDHPGCGVVFDVWIAPVWDPSAQSSVGRWDLTAEVWDIDGCDSTTKLKAVDLRKGVPLPEKYATGIFVPRISLIHGVILEAMEIDCESPGSCGFCDPEA